MSLHAGAEGNLIFRGDKVRKGLREGSRLWYLRMLGDAWGVLSTKLAHSWTQWASPGRAPLSMPVPLLSALNFFPPT